MRRPSRKRVENAGWMISFADLTTLLLTFLVLIIGITTNDAAVGAFAPPESGREAGADFVRRGDGVLMYSDRSLLAPVIELAENLENLPDDVMFDQREFRRAVFQLDPVKTPDFRHLEEAAQGIEFAGDSRGLIIKWDRALLFREGEAVLLHENAPLLDRLAVFLKNVTLPVSLESHTGPPSGLEGGEAAAYELSIRRSKAVMEYLTGLRLAPERFRLGGFGHSRPRVSDPERAWENDRMEIILYRPERSSWRG